MDKWSSKTLHRNGDNFVDERGKKEELTQEEQIAIDLLDKCRVILKELPELISGGRAVSMSIFEDHLAVLATQYHEGEDPTTIAHVWCYPEKPSVTVIRL